MDIYLEHLSYDFKTTSYTIPEELTRIIQRGFIDNNDCVTLKGFGHVENPNFQTAKEKCDWEYNETHFHPDWSVIGEKAEETEYLKAALECGKRLAWRLQETYTNKHFRIVIAFSETTYDEKEVDCYGSSTVRFYQIRQEAEESFRVGNLDDFQTEAVMNIEV